MDVYLCRVTATLSNMSCFVNYNYPPRADTLHNFAMIEFNSCFIYLFISLWT